MFEPARGLAASTYAYVNPMVAVILGWLFAGETLGLREGVAALSILSSVVLITYGNRGPRPTEGKGKPQKE